MISRQALHHEHPHVPGMNGDSIRLDLVHAPEVRRPRLPGPCVVECCVAVAGGDKLGLPEFRGGPQIDVVGDGPVARGPTEQGEHDRTVAIGRTWVAGLVEGREDSRSQVDDLALRQGPGQDMDFVDSAVERLVVIAAVLAKTERDIGVGGAGRESAGPAADDFAVDIDLRGLAVAGADDVLPFIDGGRDIGEDVQAKPVRASPLNHAVAVTKLENPAPVVVAEALAGDALPVAVGSLPVEPGRDGQFAAGGGVVGAAVDPARLRRVHVERDRPAPLGVGDDRRPIHRRAVMLVAGIILVVVFMNGVVPPQDLPPRQRGPKARHQGHTQQNCGLTTHDLPP